MVNPRAKVYLDWSCIDGAAAAEQRLLDKGVRIVSSQDLKKTARDERTAFGLYEFKEGKKENLAMLSDASHFQFKVTLVTFRAVPSSPLFPGLLTGQPQWRIAHSLTSPS